MHSCAAQVPDLCIGSSIRSPTVVLLRISPPFVAGACGWPSSVPRAPAERRERPHGKSGWTLKKKIKYFTDLLLDSSYAPIQLMSRLGLVVAAAGLIYAIVIVVAYLLNETPFPGWAPIMVTLLVLGGTIMIMLGISGEYLWRIYDEIKAKPLFVVQDVVGRGRSRDERESL